jgi:hypothetical protein
VGVTVYLLERAREVAARLMCMMLICGVGPMMRLAPAVVWVPGWWELERMQGVGQDFIIRNQGR